MKIKTSELEGAALDWAVCAAIGKFDDGEQSALAVASGYFTPSRNWAHGGPLMGQRIVCVQSFDSGAYFSCVERYKLKAVYGPTMLIAAMRAIVSAELGDEVDVPEELL